MAKTFKKCQAFGRDLGSEMLSSIVRAKQETLRKQSHILRQRFETNTIVLNNGNSDMTCLARVKISHGSGLACVRSPDHLTKVAIFYFWCC
jgi:hypothetical protein